MNHIYIKCSMLSVDFSIVTVLSTVEESRLFYGDIQLESLDLNCKGFE